MPTVRITTISSAKSRALSLCAALLLGSGCLLPAHAQSSTKDIVLDRIATRPAATAPANVHSDAMSVSVLVESPNGSLQPRSTAAVFHSGERMRVKMLAARTGKVSIYNTNAAGKVSLVWGGPITAGKELISPRLALKGMTGNEQLHILLEPAAVPPQGINTWVNRMIAWVKDSSTSKDIRLDVQSTETTTYLLNPSNQGLATTINITHVR